MPRRSGVHLGQTADLTDIHQDANPNRSGTDVNGSISLKVRRESTKSHTNTRRRGSAGNGQCKAETRKMTKSRRGCYRCGSQTAKLIGLLDILRVARSGVSLRCMVDALV